MNKKILALIIFVVAVVSIYGLSYAAVTTVLMPQDLNHFKNELDTMPQLPVINNSAITETESSAAVMESYSPLKDMSKSQRTAMADQMRNYNAIPMGLLNQNFTEYANYNNYRTIAYSIVLNGDLSSEIKNLSSSYEKISSLSDEMVALSQKMATDFENGNDKAYADDLRRSANIMKQYNIEMAVLKTKLQTIVNQLGG